MILYHIVTLKTDLFRKIRDNGMYEIKENFGKILQKKKLYINENNIPYPKQN